MINVLHITPHTGGGLGAVIKNLIDNNKTVNHKIISLMPADDREIQIDGMIHDGLKNIAGIHSLIQQCDIILLHWFNHPSLYEFLITSPIPASRLIIWAHANNLYPPYVIPERLVDMCDRFIFTSPVSYQAKEYQELSDEQKKKFGVIWSVADMKRFYNVKKVPHDTFNIGYAGTIDFNSKLHPDYVALCAKVADLIPNARFIVCSSGPDLEKLKQQVKDKGLWDKFEFTGRVDDLAPWFALMDVFGYPLYEKHYGTCEQVLGEAMAAGVVPVVLDNPAEKFIATVPRYCTKREYPEWIEEIYYLHEDGKKYLAERSKIAAQSIYSTGVMCHKWETEFNNIMSYNKSVKSWYGKRKGSFLFLESLGQYAKAFKDGDKTGIEELLKQSRQWQSESKGSVNQYVRAYPEDDYLRQWKKISEGIK